MNGRVIEHEVLEFGFIMLVLLNIHLFKGILDTSSASSSRIKLKLSFYIEIHAPYTSKPGASVL